MGSDEGSTAVMLLFLRPFGEGGGFFFWWDFGKNRRSPVTTPHQNRPLEIWCGNMGLAAAGSPFPLPPLARALPGVPHNTTKRAGGGWGIRQPNPLRGNPESFSNKRGDAHHKWLYTAS